MSNIMTQQDAVKSKTQVKADKRAAALRENLKKRKMLEKSKRGKEKQDEQNDES